MTDAAPCAHAAVDDPPRAADDALPAPAELDDSLLAPLRALAAALRQAGAAGASADRSRRGERSW